MNAGDWITRGVSLLRPGHAPDGTKAATDSTRGKRAVGPRVLPRKR